MLVYNQGVIAMAVFTTRKLDATTIQTTLVCQHRGSTEGYNAVRLLDINGNLIGKAVMDFEDDAPFYRQYRKPVPPLPPVHLSLHIA